MRQLQLEDLSENNNRLFAYTNEHLGKNRAKGQNRNGRAEGEHPQNSKFCTQEDPLKAQTRMLLGQLNKAFVTQSKR